MTVCEKCGGTCENPISECPDYGWMEQIGTIYRDKRDVYLVIDADREVYYFSAGRFNQGLTKFSDKGATFDQVEKEMDKLTDEDIGEEKERLK
jgi:hypothetical protein